MPSLGPCCRKTSCPNNLPPNSGISNLNSLGPKPWPSSLSGKAPSSTETLCARPSRQKVNCTVRPPGVSRISRRNWSVPSTRWPLNSVMTSLALRPALAAGLSASTLLRITPRAAGSFNSFALSAVTSAIVTPSQPGLPSFSSQTSARPSSISATAWCAASSATVSTRLSISSRSSSIFATAWSSFCGSSAASTLTGRSSISANCTGRTASRRRFSSAVILANSALSRACSRSSWAWIPLHSFRGFSCARPGRAGTVTVNSSAPARIAINPLFIPSSYCHSTPPAG